MSSNSAGRPTAVRAEPLAADFTVFGRDMAALKLISGLLGLGFDSLYQRERRRTARRRLAVGSGAAAIGIALAALSVTATLFGVRAQASEKLAVERLDEVSRQRSIIDLRRRQAETLQARAEFEAARAVSALKLARRNELLAERNQKAAQASAAQARRSAALALSERDAAQRARGVAQTALDKAVNRLTQVAYRDDARLEGLQQGLLEDLVPVYLQLANEAADDPGMVAGYARAVDELALLASSNTSLGSATTAYQQIFDQLDRTQARDPAAAALRQRVGLNYSATLANDGQSARARAVLTGLDPATRSSAAAQCLGFRLQILEEGEDYGAGERDAVLAAALGWQAAELADRKARAGCLTVLGSTYTYHNEYEPAERSLAEATRELDGLLAEKPFSVPLHIQRGDLHLARNRYLFFRRDQKATDPDLLWQAEIKEGMARMSKAADLSPDSRSALEAKLRATFIASRLAEAVPGSGRSTLGDIDPTGWIDVAERLIQRDPASVALETSLLDYANIALSPASDPEKGSVVTAEQRRDTCRRIADGAIAVANRLPQAFVAQRLAAGVSTCLNNPAGVPEEERGTDRPSEAYASRREEIDRAWARATELAPDPARRWTVIRQHLGALGALPPDEERRNRSLLAIANREAARFPNSMRFTVLAGAARALLAKQFAEAGNEAEARKFVSACEAHSDRQSLACRSIAQWMARGMVGDKVAALVGASPPEAETIVLGIVGAPGNQASSSLWSQVFDPLNAVEAVRLEGGRAVLTDDVDVTREVSVSLAEAQRRVGGNVLPFLAEAMAEGFPFRESYRVFRGGIEALAGSGLAEAELRRQRAAWTSFLTKKIEREVQSATSATPPGANGWRSSLLALPSGPAVLDPSVLEEKVVITLQGKNVFGTQIFTYMRMTLRQLQMLRDKMRAGQDFRPDEFGENPRGGPWRPIARAEAANGERA